MRQTIIAGNWKMFKTVTESVDFVRQLLPRLEPFSNVERVVCPTFVALAPVADVLRGSALKVGAQNVAFNKEGAYTSQIAPGMLQGLVDYVIIGHSEARKYLGETDEDINKKAKIALEYGLKPIIAVGESLETYEAGQTAAFVGGQVRAALSGISAEQMANIVIAYEPIWAIGTGKNASADLANQIISGAVRGTVRDLYGDVVAGALRIQYGGSVKPDNMADYMSQPDIDGALVGGASLKLDDFTKLVEAAAQVK